MNYLANYISNNLLCNRCWKFNNANAKADHWTWFWAV